MALRVEAERKRWEYVFQAGGKAHAEHKAMKLSDQVHVWIVRKR